MKAFLKRGIITIVLAIVLTVSDAGAILPVLPVSTTAEAITLDKTVNIKVGKSAKLKAKGAKSVKWTSKNKKIAKVSAKGVVKAVAPGQTTIIAKDKKTGETVKCTVNCYSLKSPSAVKKALYKQKNGKYYEGRPWTNDDPNGGYYWECAPDVYGCGMYGFGCYGFAALMSDKVFGKGAKLVRHYSFANIQPGDHIRLPWHSVIVISRKGNTLTVAEGNFNSSIHWGRKITKEELGDDFEVLSRR
ncbi:MAG: Ig-like domain-containing protein [Lachnospiraceae bacterium]|nr:Ig-like domain-containing protein [Lachnospiraceae bacterium]